MRTFMIYITEDELKQMVLETYEKSMQYIMEGEMLNESFSRNLYHYTTIADLQSMLLTGKWHLKQAHTENSFDFIMNKAKPIKHRPTEFYKYYLCLTRQRHSEMGYPEQENDNCFLKSKKQRNTQKTYKMCVRIEVDIKILTHYFKALCVNYFQPSNTGAWPNKEKSFVPIERRFELNQTEERALSNKPFFSLIDCPDLIKRIDIYFPKDFKTNQESVVSKLSWIINDYTGPLKNKIHYYNNVKDFNGLQKGQHGLEPRTPNQFNINRSSYQQIVNIPPKRKEAIARYVIMLSSALGQTFERILVNICDDVFGTKDKKINGEINGFVKEIIDIAKKLAKDNQNTPWENFKRSGASLDNLVRNSKGVLKAIFNVIQKMIKNVFDAYKCSSEVKLYAELVIRGIMPPRPSKKAARAQTVDSPTKRGPGRPRKTVDVAETTPKRGPGRPRKTTNAAETTPKRGPGRPRKNPL